ncbi:MAG: (4Fe-4S)-binding protein, partial [Longimicrobiales bacterium]
FDPNLCIHSGACVRGLPAVFDVGRRDWVRPDAASAADVAAQIQRCPSGALQFRLPAPQSSSSEDPSQPLSNEGL